MKLKSTEEILEKILYREFLNDLNSGKICPSDMIFWIKMDQEEVESYYKKWLISQGYAVEDD